MRRSQDDLNLRNAFPPVPESLEKSLLQSASSVQEGPAPKKFTAKTLLIAALILLAAMSAALAASELLGWTDFFSKNYAISVPKAAQNAMNITQGHTFQAGPLTFTVHETICDGRIALSSIEAHTTDGSDALYTGDAGGVVGANSSSEAERLGLDPGIPWTEAARTLNLPLYAVRAFIEPDAAVDSGEAMEDWMWNANGHIVYFNMPSLNQRAEKYESLPVTFCLAVWEIDPATGDDKAAWVLREKGTIPIRGKLAEKTYLPVGEALINGYRIESVKAEQYVTGAYLTITLSAPEGAPPETASSLWELMEDITLTDERKQPFPAGISLSGGMDADNWPAVFITKMISVDALPGAMLLTAGNAAVMMR